MRISLKFKYEEGDIGQFYYKSTDTYLTMREERVKKY